MAEAKTALEILSREPSAQRIAEMRREAEIERRLDRADAAAEQTRRLLCRGLETRFGELPESARERIVKADLPQLEAWMDRLYVVSSFEELLGAE